MQCWNILCALLLLPCFCFARINFLHIPKTGGSSMLSLLRQNFAESEFYPFKDLGVQENSIEERPFESQEEMFALFDQFPPITQKISRGHFPFWFLQHQDPHFDSSFTFTILRAPLSRVISQYHFKVGVGETIGSPTEVCPNLMCKMLCSDCTLRGEELLEDCKRNLESLDFIIFLDDFENCVDRLFKKLRFKHKGDVPEKNKSKKKRVITEEEKQGVRELNDLDIRLYEYAKTNLWHKSY